MFDSSLPQNLDLSAKQWTFLSPMFSLLSLNPLCPYPPVSEALKSESKRLKVDLPWPSPWSTWNHFAGPIQGTIIKQMSIGRSIVARNCWWNSVMLELVLKLLFIHTAIEVETLEFVGTLMKQYFTVWGMHFEANIYDTFVSNSRKGF